MRFRLAFSAIETSQKIEISPVASLDMILSSDRKTKALIRLHNPEDSPTYVLVAKKGI